MRNSADTNKMQNILVISKDEEMLNVWTTFFKEKNYVVVSENEVTDSIQTARLLTPALTIIDLDLPQKERVEFCRALRATSNGALILLAPRTNNFVDYYQAGVDECITTPTNPMAVLIKSITWLARKEWITPRKETVHTYV